MELSDKWSSWLLERRHGGDRAVFDSLLPRLNAARDRVLDNADVEHASTLLDVGAGDGLIAFGALERMQPDGRVIFSDISESLLIVGRALARDFGVSDRIDFVRSEASDLKSIADASVDVVTTRSVLIYERDKRRAFHEFYRVLRSGGRVSVAEPINRDAETEDFAEIADLQAILRAKDDIEESPETSPMLDFTERDLLRMAREAGFAEVHVDLRISYQVREPMSWETHLNIAPNPNASTMRDYYASAFTPAQFVRFESHMRRSCPSAWCMKSAAQ